MSISEGARIPDAKLMRLTDDGFETVDLNPYIKGRRVIIFGLPGAFTGDCSTVHVPSFIRTADAFAERGVDEIICVAVNDPFVMRAWGEVTGAAAAGITMLSDPDAALTQALDMAFTAPQVGLYNRSNRYAVIVEDGLVSAANIDAPGVCDLTTGETLLERLPA